MVIFNNIISKLQAYKNHHILEIPILLALQGYYETCLESSNRGTL